MLVIPYLDADVTLSSTAFMSLSDIFSLLMFSTENIDLTST